MSAPKKRYQSESEILEDIDRWSKKASDLLDDADAMSKEGRRLIIEASGIEDFDKHYEMESQGEEMLFQSGSRSRKSARIRREKLLPLKEKLSEFRTELLSGVTDDKSIPAV